MAERLLVEWTMAWPKRATPIPFRICERHVALVEQLHTSLPVD